MSGVSLRASLRSFDTTGTLAIVGNLACWAVVPVFLRELTGSLDAWTANGLRYPVVAILYWPVLFRAASSGRLNRRVLLLALGPAVLSFGGQVFWGLSPYYLEASSIGFLIKVAIVWALIGSMLLIPSERALLRRPRFYIGVVLAIAGFLFLAGNQGALESRLTRDGVLILLACSLFFGFYGVSIRYFMEGIPAVLAFAVVCQYVSLGTLSLMFLKGDMSVIPSFSGKTWLLLALSSFLGVGLSHVFYYMAIQRLGPSIASAMHLLTPFLTLALAHLALGETMGPADWVAGFMLVLGGGFLLQSPRKPVTAKSDEVRLTP